MSGPRNTRDSLTISKLKPFTDVWEEGEAGSTEAVLGSIDGDQVVAKETKQTSAVLSDTPKDKPSGLDPEEHTSSSQKHRQKSFSKPASPSASPRTRRKLPSTIDSTPPSSPRTFPKRHKKKRSKSVDVKGSELLNDKERRRSRKPSTKMRRSTSELDFGRGQKNEEDHDFTISNGTRTSGKPAKSHNTRRKETKRSEQRMDYNIRGGWGNPLDLGAAPMGSSPNMRRNSSCKNVANSS